MYFRMTSDALSSFSTGGNPVGGAAVGLLGGGVLPGFIPRAAEMFQS